MQPPRSDMSPPARFGPGRILLIVLGSLLALIGLAGAVGGGGLLVANATLRDESGYFSSGFHPYATSKAAITSESLDVTDIGPLGSLSSGGLGTLRIRARMRDGSPLFIGVARRSDLSGYLRGVPHDELNSVDFRPFRTRVTPIPGSNRPSPPESRTFWAARASGSGEQVLTWKIREGTWSVAAMRLTGAPGVDMEAAIGAKVRWLVPLSLGLLAGGALAIGLGTTTILLSTRRRHRGSVPEQDSSPLIDGVGIPVDRPANAYPIVVEGRLDAPLSRWLWLVKWLLIVPHIIVLAFLWLALVVSTIVAFFAILITARYPRGIFDFNVGVLRWTWRVAFYAYGANGTDRYPPFNLGAEPDYPATLDIPYPEHLSRGLVLVKSWLLAIPHLLITGLFAGGLSPWGGGLIGVMVLISAMYLLVTGRPFLDLFDFIIGMNRWVYRVMAYVLLMRDEYPPFRLGPE